MRSHTWVVEVLDDVIDYAERNHLREFAMDLRCTRAKYHSAITGPAQTVDYPAPREVVAPIPFLEVVFREIFMSVR